MSIKLATLAYAPPPSFGCARVFMENLQKFPSRYDLLIYSEHDWPGAIKIKSPEILKGAKFADGKPNKFAIPNATFFTGLRIAASKGYTHMLFLESDCRVGQKHYDEVIFDEFFSMGRPLIAAGTLACFNPCAAGGESARRWARLVARNIKRNVPVATYGWLPALVKGPSCVFPNGALAVYDVTWCQRFWDLGNTIQLSALTTAYDMALGTEIWKRFEEDSYEVVGWLDSVGSFYGDVLTSALERREMLLSGKIVAGHQHKDDWQP